MELSVTREHRFKVREGKFKGDVQGRFFTQRMMGAWNALPEEVIEAGTLATIKRHLDGYMNREGIEGYGPRKGRSSFLIGMGLESRRVCSCAVLFFVLCSLSYPLLYPVSIAVCPCFTLQHLLWQNLHPSQSCPLELSPKSSLPCFIFQSLLNKHPFHLCNPSVTCIQ